MAPPPDVIRPDLRTWTPALPTNPLLLPVPETTTPPIPPDVIRPESDTNTPDPPLLVTDTAPAPPEVI